MVDHETEIYEHSPLFKIKIRRTYFEQRFGASNLNVDQSKALFNFILSNGKCPYPCI